MQEAIQDTNTGNTIIIVDGFVFIRHIRTHELTDTEGNVLANMSFSDEALQIAHKLVSDYKAEHSLDD